LTSWLDYQVKEKKGLVARGEGEGQQEKRIKKKSSSKIREWGIQRKAITHREVRATIHEVVYLTTPTQVRR